MPNDPELAPAHSAVGAAADDNRRSEDFYLATNEDFLLATSGDPSMAMGRSYGREQSESGGEHGDPPRADRLSCGSSEQGAASERSVRHRSEPAEYLQASALGGEPPQRV